MDEFGLVWLSSVWFDEVDFLRCSRSASQLSFTNLFFSTCHFTGLQHSPSPLELLLPALLVHKTSRILKPLLFDLHGGEAGYEEE